MSEMGNINSLVGDINRRGIARQNRFSFTIFPNQNLLSTVLRDIDIRSLTIRCESANMPGKGFASSEHKMHGPFRKKPYESIYEDVTATFRLSHDLHEKDIFYKWMELIQDTHTGNFGWQEDYISTIYIKQFDETNSSFNKEKYGIKLYDAWPMNVSAIDYDMGSTNDYAKLSVTFAYHKWDRI